MKKLFFLLIGLSLMFSYAIPAQAFTEGACRADEKKYCDGVPLLGGKLKECMEKHVEQLSDACKANMLEVMLKEKKAKEGKAS